MIPMSSIPLQMLIYVVPQPQCTQTPIISPLNGCHDVQVGVSTSFNISIVNLCNSSVVTIVDITVSSSIAGMNYSNVTDTTNSTVSYVTFNWTPQINQLGSQQLCLVALTR